MAINTPFPAIKTSDDGNSLLTLKKVGRNQNGEKYFCQAAYDGDDATFFSDTMQLMVMGKPSELYMLLAL